MDKFYSKKLFDLMKDELRSIHVKEKSIRKVGATILNCMWSIHPGSDEILYRIYLFLE